MISFENIKEDEILDILDQRTNLPLKVPEEATGFSCR